MKLDKTTRRQLTLQNSLFYLLLAIVVFLLSQIAIQTDHYADWTANQRLSLSESSQRLLDTLSDDISIQVFISPENEYKAAITQILQHYQSYSPHIKVRYIDPATAPEQVRQFQISKQGEMVISQGSRQTHVFDVSEQSITHALMRVSRNQTPWILFLTGHGERTPLEKHNYNYSVWGKQLTQTGFKLRELNLINDRQIPRNTGLLVIASPQQDLLPGEIHIINTYLDQGGHLLLLTDPETYPQLTPVSEHLNIDILPGTIMDPNAQLLGIDDPAFVLVNDYANHPVSHSIPSVTLFPRASALQLQHTDEQWHSTALLKTQANAWLKTAEDTHTRTGPFTLGYLLERTQDDKTQRIAVLGDADFIANSYIGNAANQDLAMSLVNWLTEQDNLVAIPVKTAVDTQLALSKTQSLVIGIGFLFILPLLLLLTGLLIWKKRRQR